MNHITLAGRHDEGSKVSESIRSVFLEAADGDAARAAAAEQINSVALEIQEPCYATENRTRPIVAEGANIEERTTAEVA